MYFHFCSPFLLVATNSPCLNLGMSPKNVDHSLVKYVNLYFVLFNRVKIVVNFKETLGSLDNFPFLCAFVNIDLEGLSSLIQEIADHLIRIMKGFVWLFQLHFILIYRLKITFGGAKLSDSSAWI